MTNLDDAIREALSAEDAKLLEGFGADQALYNQIFQAFQGKLGWINAVGWLGGLLFFAAFVYCAWQFTTVSETRDLLMWGGGAALAFIALAMVKLWFWMELQKNAIVREVKRLELQVARLGARGRA
jgi:hypothetical protein